VRIPTDQRFAPLLVTQRFERIKIRGLLRGIKTKEDADGAGEKKGDSDDDHVDVSDFVNNGLKPLYISPPRGLLGRRIPVRRPVRGACASSAGLLRGLYVDRHRSFSTACFISSLDHDPIVTRFWPDPGLLSTRKNVVGCWTFFAFLQDANLDQSIQLTGSRFGAHFKSLNAVVACDLPMLIAHEKKSLEGHPLSRQRKPCQPELARLRRPLAYMDATCRQPIVGLTRRQFIECGRAFF